MAKTSKDADRRAVVERLRREQQRKERRNSLMVLGAAVTVGVLIILGWVGFDQTPGAANTSTALTTLTALFLAVPTVLLFASAWALNKYPLGGERHAEVRTRLAERDAAAAAAVVTEPA